MQEGRVLCSRHGVLSNYVNYLDWSSLINGQSGASWSWNVITSPRETDESYILVLLSCVSFIARFSPWEMRVNGMGIAETETQVLWSGSLTCSL